MNKFLCTLGRERKREKIRYYKNSYFICTGYYKPWFYFELIALHYMPFLRLLTAVAAENENYS